jgi:hypothetical protein
MPDPNNYTALTAAERAAAAEEAAAATAAAQRAPMDAYNALLTHVDLTNRSQERQQINFDAYNNDTNGFATDAKQHAHNRRWTRSLLVTLIFLVPMDAVLLLSGFAKVIADSWFATDATWVISVTATVLSLVVWGITLGWKAMTSTVKQKARLQIATNPTEVRRLHRIIHWKIAGRVAYMLALAGGLFYAHESVRDRLEWMNEMTREMVRQNAGDQLSAQSVITEGTVVTQPAAEAVSASLVKSVSTGVEVFVLCLLWALHGIVLMVYPSFSPVNPFGPPAYDPAVSQGRLDDTTANKSRMIRELWDRLNNLPADQRQGRVDAMPTRIATLINEEFGRNIIITNVAAQGHQPPEEPPDATSPASPPDDEQPLPRGPVPRPRPAEDDVPAPDPMIGVV